LRHFPGCPTGTNRTPWRAGKTQVQNVYTGFGQFRAEDEAGPGEQGGKPS